MNRTPKLVIVYLFSWLGSLIMLAVEKEDEVVREHAAQGLGWGIVSFVLAAHLCYRYPADRQGLHGRHFQDSFCV